jgi:hypothetical protein
VATASDPYNVIPTITEVARANGVDPNLAIAIAKQESGLNPYAVGDNGTSFGLYQLHIGGELPAAWQAGPWVQGPKGRIPAQAADPRANAQVSLAVVGAVARQNPGLSPGEIAAKAQRPANQSAYARSVNSLIGGSSNYSALGQPSSGGQTATPTGVPGGSIIPGIQSAADMVSLLKALFSPTTAIRVLETVAGTVVLGAGLCLLTVAIAKSPPAPVRKGARRAVTVGKSIATRKPPNPKDLAE